MSRCVALLCTISMSFACAGGFRVKTPPATESSKRPREDLPASSRPFEVKRHTRGLAACLVVSDRAGVAIVRSAAARCAQRFRPYSTFKIANAIVGLEVGVLSDDRTVVPWDQDKYPKKSWWPAVWTQRTHDLRSAFRHSFVPFFRALALQIGRRAMQRHLSRWSYGNANIEGALDSFWLDGQIAISADEQVRFLRAFYDERLGARELSTRTVKDILVRERLAGYLLSAKTGSGSGPHGKALGWIVGYVEHDGLVHFYAFNVSGEPARDSEGRWRYRMLKDILAELELWPGGLRSR